MKKEKAFLMNLISNLDIDENVLNKIEEYDKNIREYLNHINSKRDNKINLKYFQYLAVLFTEIYLDNYFNRKNEFLK